MFLDGIFGCELVLESIITPQAVMTSPGLRSTRGWVLSWWGKEGPSILRLPMWYPTPLIRDVTLPFTSLASNSRRDSVTTLSLTSIGPGLIPPLSTQSLWVKLCCKPNAWRSFARRPSTRVNPKICASALSSRPMVMIEVILRASGISGGLLGRQ